MIANNLSNDDMPIEMEDPFKPEAKRCFLCGVRIDYKNAQLLSQFISSHTGIVLSEKASGESPYLLFLACVF